MKTTSRVASLIVTLSMVLFLCSAASAQVLPTPETEEIENLISENPYVTQKIYKPTVRYTAHNSDNDPAEDTFQRFDLVIADVGGFTKDDLMALTKGADSGISLWHDKNNNGELDDGENLELILYAWADTGVSGRWKARLGLKNYLDISSEQTVYIVFRPSSTIEHMDSFEVKIDAIYFEKETTGLELPWGLAQPLVAELEAPTTNIIQSPTDSIKKWKDDNIEFEGSDGEGESGLDFTELWYKHKPWNNNKGTYGSWPELTKFDTKNKKTGTFSFKGAGKPAGKFQFKTIAYDKAGNKGESPLSDTVIFDNLPPTVLSDNATDTIPGADRYKHELTITFTDQQIEAGGSLDKTTDPVVKLELPGGRTFSTEVAVDDPKKITKTSYDGVVWKGTWTYTQDPNIGGEEGDVDILTSDAKDELDNPAMAETNVGKFQIDYKGPWIERCELWVDKDGNGNFSKGDTVHLIFSELVDHSTVTPSNLDSALLLFQPGESWTTSADDGNATGSWGTNPTLDWNVTENVTLIITLGENPAMDESILKNPATLRVRADDEVKDPKGNTAEEVDPPAGPKEITDNEGPKLLSVKHTDSVNKSGGEVPEEKDGFISAGDTLEFTFSEPMDTNTITAANVNNVNTVLPPNGHSYGTQANGMNVKWPADKDNKVCKVTLGTDFTVQSTDQVTPTNAVKDDAEAGNSASGTVTILDETPPMLEDALNTKGNIVIPAINNANGEWMDNDGNRYLTDDDIIYIDFKEPMSGKPVGEKASDYFSLSAGSWGDSKIAALQNSDDDDKDGYSTNNRFKIEVMSGIDIPSGTTITPNSNVKDLAGNSYDGTGDLVFKDDLKPKVIDNVVYNDIDGSAGVGNDGAGVNAASAGDPVTINFIEPMDQSTITAANLDTALALSGNGTWGTNPTVSWSGNSKQVKITLGQSPSIDAGNATITPAKSVKDLAGNENDQTTANFPADNVKPYLTNFITWKDENGNGKVDASAPKGDFLQFNFSEAMNTSTITQNNVSTALGGGDFGTIAYHMYVMWVDDDTLQVTLGYHSDLDVNSIFAASAPAADVAGLTGDGSVQQVIAFCATSFTWSATNGDNNDNGEIDAGDVLQIQFSRAVDTSTINAGTLDTDIPLLQGGNTWGSSPGLDWVDDRTVNVTLGSGEDLTDDIQINPANSVMDRAGNQDKTSLPLQEALELDDDLGPNLTLTLPAKDGESDTTIDVKYTLSEKCSIVKLKFKRTGGSSDPNSPHVVTELPTGKGENTSTISANLVDGAVYTVTLEADDMYGNAQQASAENTNWVYYTWTKLGVALETSGPKVQNEQFNIVITARDEKGIVKGANFTVNFSADKLGVEFPAGDNHLLKHGKLTVPVVVLKAYGSDNPLHISAQEWWQGEYREFRHGTSDDIVVKSSAAAQPTFSVELATAGPKTQNEPFDIIVKAKKADGTEDDTTVTQFKLSTNKLAVTFPSGDQKMENGVATVPVEVSKVYTAADGLKISATEVNSDADALRYGESDFIVVESPSPAAPDKVIASASKITASLEEEVTIEAKVTDESDNLVPGVTVEFTTSTEGASLDPASATTNAEGKATSTLTVSATEGDNVVDVAVKDTSVTDSVTVQGIDDIPPVIDHTPVSEATAGEPYTITATITDDHSDVSVVDFYYRVGGYANPREVQKKDITVKDDTYTATIKDVKVRGLAYSIRAEDTKGNKAEDGNIDNMNNVTVSGSMTTPEFVGQDLYLISTPLELSTPKTVAELFTTDNWLYAKAYNATTGSYSENIPVEPSVGIFVSPVENRALTIEGTSADITKDSVIPLEPGWNLIGLPFSFSRYWNNDTIHVERNGEVQNISEASKSIWIYDTIYTYEDGKGYIPISPGTTTNSVLDCHAGFWVLAFTRNVNLHISPRTFGPDDKPPVAAAPAIPRDKLPTIAGFEPPKLPFDTKYLPGGAFGRNGVGQNYPNPFNPETWIPYQFEEDVNSVTIEIYDARGKLVKTLDLGSKSRGLYMDKDKAAYWNGTNEIGERVASGIYFYKLKADSYNSSTFKMVILK